jgi:hypothetical protein
MKMSREGIVQSELLGICRSKASTNHAIIYCKTFGRG